MAQNKKELFAEADIQLSEMMKSLSHPARVQIMRILAEKNSCICGEIVEILPLAQSTVSQHLIELKKAGLVKGTIDGAKSCYCIDWENFKKLEEFLGFFVENINESKGRCC